MAKVRVVPHNTKWRELFEEESSGIRAALGENARRIHHIGSTAIPDIYAKPVVDMLIEIGDLAELESRNQAMERLGYEVMGEFGMPGRRYYRKDDAVGTRLYQVHAFAAGSDEVHRHLAFRDYLIQHPIEAREYSDLKRKLAESHSDSTDAYMDGKDASIKEIDRKAARWADAQRFC